ncbi:sodium-coupled monocarboxylate transporter 1-like [Ciona intestinalis]
MIETAKKRGLLGALDLVLFTASLLLTFLVGGYYAYKARRDDSVANYYFGNRKMPPIPLGLSMAVSFISGVAMIGLPTETYMFGMVNMWYIVGSIIPSIIVFVYLIPLYYRLELSTIYEYLEIRFNRKCRMISSAAETMNLTLYMGVTVYLPALALSAVTPISIHLAIILTSVICTIYTVCGGLKTVVWTDTLQSGIMFFGALAFMIKATLVVGGFDEIAAALERGGRNNIFDFNLDPKARQAAVSIFIGMNNVVLYAMACSQPNVQRLMSCKSIKDARIATMVSCIPKVLITLLSIGCGAAAYAYYEHCDPLSSGQISKPDQLLPFMAVDIFNSIPGLAGLFVAALYSGTLSTVSSGINSASAMILEDFILPIKPSLSEKSQLFVSKITGCACGSIHRCSIHLLDCSWRVGLWKGSSYRWCAACSNRWLREYKLHQPEYMERYTTFYDVVHRPATEYFGLYGITFLYYSSIGSIITIIVGLLVSIITGANDPQKSNPDVFVPILDNKCFPESVRHFFRFGVPPRKTGCGKDEVNYETDDVGEEVGIKLQQTNHPESNHSDETKALNVEI